MGEVQAHVWISGVVQGVSFRYYTAVQADSWGLSGWVRNLDDGRVEAVFYGGEGAVQAMLGWCQHGPPSAQVSDVEVRTEQPESHDGFQIRMTARGKII